MNTVMTNFRLIFFISQSIIRLCKWSNVSFGYLFSIEDIDKADSIMFRLEIIQKHARDCSTWTHLLNIHTKPEVLAMFNFAFICLGCTENEFESNRS